MYLDVVKFQNFLSIGTSKTIRPIEIYGYNQANNEKLGHDMKINIFFSETAKNHNYYESTTSYHMLFDYQKIKDTFSQKFSNWFNRADILDTVMDQYFFVIDRNISRLELNFLQLIQAIESYHRRTRTNTAIPIEEHELRIKNILESVPEEHRKWLAQKIHYSNEPSLRQRLKDIYDQFSEILSPIFNKKKLINKAVDTRNYLTHFDQSLKDKSLNGMRLYYFLERLKLILQICLLSEIGFSNSEIIKLFKKNTTYNMFLKAAKSNK